jgi:hypothetical protein
MDDFILYVLAGVVLCSFAGLAIACRKPAKNDTGATEGDWWNIK